jgi:hypothetical protein
MYKHTQLGYAAIVVVIAVLLGIATEAVFKKDVAFDWTVYAIVGVVIVVVGALFSSLTIQVADSRLTWHFAIPAVSNSIPLADIASVDVVRNPIIYGWGMHMIRRGWVYNVSGRSAVEVNLKDGTRLRLGSDEPDLLIRAITQEGIPSSGLHGAEARSSRLLHVTF